MSIYLYSGTPGSGKSLHACRDIYDQLYIKRYPVIANFEVKVKKDVRKGFKCVPNDELHPDKLVLWASDFWNGKKFKEDGILLVLDECQLLFNSRSWNDKQRMDWISFFSQHRKFGYKIIFIAQYDEMIDKQIRSVIEYEVTHRKFGNFGLFGSLFSLLTFSQWFIAITRYYSMSQRLGSEWFRYRKKYAQMYDSYATFNANSKARTREARPPSEPLSGVKLPTLKSI